MDTKNTFRYAWQPYVVAIAIIAVAAALRLWPLYALGARLAWLTFYPAVMVAALYGGFSAGFLGTFLSCLTVLFLLPVFVHQPFIKDSADWLGLAVFFATCAMISGIAEATRRAQAREKQAEAEGDRFFTLSLDLLCIAKADGYFKHVNPAFTRTLGWSAEEILARPFLDFVHPDDHATTLREVEKQLVAGEKVLNFVNRYRHKDGSWRWLSWQSVPAPDGLMYATARDITEIRRVEETRLRLAAIVESSDDAIISKNLDGVITSWNAGAERLFGYTAAEIIGWPMTRLIPPDRLDEEPKILERLKRGERVDNFETVRVRKDGTFVDVSATISPIKDGAGKVIGISKIVRDITARKRMETEISAMNADLKLRGDQLEAANKELEAFSYSVSHDLRAPLRSIDGFSQALLEDYADKLDAQGKDDLQRVRAATQRMAQLIDDMLNLSRVTRSEMKREPVDLSRLAQAIASNLQKTQPERYVEFRIAEGIVVQGDAQLMRVALENLLSNGWKFTEKRAGAKIEFGVSQHNGRPAYFVSDSGAGFEMAFADKLFKPFQRLHAMTEFKGTGIGLATVQRIIHRHGGDVWAEGKVGEGATFYFTLP